MFVFVGVEVHCFQVVVYCRFDEAHGCVEFGSVILCYGCIGSVVSSVLYVV